MIPRGPSPEERRHMLTTPEMYAPMMDFEREREEQAYLDQRGLFTYRTEPQHRPIEGPGGAK